MSLKEKKYWPPRKSWTRKKPLNGFFHFVAINYGEYDKSKWVNFVSVLDGHTGLKVKWEDIQKGNLWMPGWIKVKEKDIKNSLRDKLIKINRIEMPKENDWCLHPSDDSYLLIPSTDYHNRSW